MLQAALAAGVSAAGGDALLGRRAADAGRAAADRPLRLRPGGRDLRLPQPLPRTTASSSSAADGYKLSDEARARDRARPATRRRRSPGPALPAARAGVHPGRVRELHGAGEDYLRELHRRFRGARPGRRSTCCSTAPTAPPTGSRPRSSGGSARRCRCSPTSPTGATSTTAAAPPTSSGSPATCADGPHDIGFAFDGDGDRVLAVDRERRGRRRRRAARARGAAPARARAPRRQRRGRDGDDQLRLPRRDGAGRASRSRVTAVGDRYVLEELRRRAAGRSAASSPATSSRPPSTAPATGSPARCSRSRRSAGATWPSATRCTSCPSGS